MTAAAPARARDLLVLADRIHTCSAGGVVEAVVIRSGRIAAVGHASDLRAAAADARIIDLRGCSITPGLVDAHAHLTEWAFARRQVDLSRARSPEDAAAGVARQATDGSGWVRGRGWNPHAWNGAGVHRSTLDDVLPDRPVALQSHDMHALWVNSAALRHAGIDRGTPDPEGGTIVRDRDGEPTGLLLEWAGRMVTDLIGPPSLDDAVAAVDSAQAELHALGITGLHSLPGIHLTTPEPGAVLARMRSADTLRLRILQHVALDRLDDAIAGGMRSGTGDEWIRNGAVKMFLDGALGSRTAWMREPRQSGRQTARQ
jgi:predicted amidohydrolase YtcJ